MTILLVLQRFGETIFSFINISYAPFLTKDL